MKVFYGNKISSGVSFLYRKGGVESQIFEVRLKKRVNGGALHLAALKTYKRYPYFNSKLMEKDGDYYLVSNPVFPAPQYRRHPDRLGGFESTDHIMEVTYHSNSIVVAFHHGMCDGRGVMPFIRTLLYYYFCYRYPGQNFAVEGVHLAGEQLLDGEMDDPIDKGDFDYDPSKVFKVPRDAYSIPEVMESIERGESKYYKSEISIDSKELLDLARMYNFTPSLLVSAIMQKAVMFVHPDADKPVLCNLVCDWRESLGVKNTFRNCVSSIFLPYGKSEEEMTLQELGTHYRELVRKQKETDSARANASVMKGMADKVNSMKSLDERYRFFASFDKMVLNTFILSYTGRLDMGECERFVDSMHVYSSGTNGVSLEMIDAGGKFNIDFMQNFSSDVYLNAFCKIAHETGLSTCSASAIAEFTTPKDVVERSLKDIFMNLIHRFMPQCRL